MITELDPAVGIALGEQDQETELPNLEEAQPVESPNDNLPAPEQSEVGSEPTTTQTGQQALASVFANRADLWRYQMAKLNGSTEEDALKVGDNGVGHWGDVTATYKTPMVALPSDTPGLERGRQVRVTGPNGSTVAIVGDQMPRSDKLQGRADIDLNPAAAMAVGHPGGVVPVTWQWADSKQPDPADMPPTGEGELPDQSTQAQAQQPAQGQGMPQLLSSRSALGGTANIPTQSEIAEDNALAESISKMEVKSKNGDGSVTMNDGATKIYPGNIVVYQRGGQTFERLSDGRIRKLGAVKGAAGDDKMDTATYKALTDAGLDPQDNETRGAAWKRIADKKKQADIPSDMSGDELMKTLPPNDQALIKQLIDGKIRATDLGRAASGKAQSDRQRLLAIAGRVDPDFDLSKSQQRYTMRRELGTTKPGTMGGNLSSLNRALQHLEVLHKRASELPESDVLYKNGLENFFETQTGKPYQKAFEQARHTVATEIEKFFTGGVPSVSGVHQWEEQLSAANSKEQLNKIIVENIPDLLHGGFSALRGSWNRTFPKPPEQMGEKPFVDHDSLMALRKIGADTSKFTFDGETAAQPSSPADLKAGDVFQDGKGKRWRVKVASPSKPEDYEPQ